MTEQQVAAVNPKQAGTSLLEEVDLEHVSVILQKIASFQTIVRSTLKDGHDYGVIPGTGDKPTLLKPGAEKVLMLLGLTSEYQVVEEVRDYQKGFFAFTIRCRLSRSGLLVTEGLGHANTKENRYSSRWVSKSKIPEGVDVNSLKTREAEGKYGKYTQYLIENDDVCTLVNTILKMAKKRAQVDAALTVGALSDIFTQDLEDLSGFDMGNGVQQHNGNGGSRKSNGRGKITDSQIRLIHKLRDDLDMSDEQLHFLLERNLGAHSLSDISSKDASSVIESFQSELAKRQGQDHERIPGEEG